MGCFKLIVFDLDGTLTKIASVWRFLHERLGVWGKARVHAEMFYRGEIDYRTWARLDVTLWKGTPFKRIEGLISEVEYVDGAYEVVEKLKSMGFKVGVISAGLDIVARKAMKDLGLDFAEANKLVVKDGVLTGDVVVRVSHHEKEKVLDKVRRGFGMRREECIAVGDDVTNISLFKAVGLSIAFNPTSKDVADNADAVVWGSLRNVIAIVEKALAKSCRGYL